MPKTIKKKEVIDIPDGKFLRVETKLSEDKKHVEVTMFYEVKTQEEIKAEERARRVAEEEERARRKTEEVAKERKEQEERERKETEAKLKKEAEEKAKKTKEKTENKTIDEAENIEPTMENYMAAIKKVEKALNALNEEERKFEARMHREAIPPQDLPEYWEKYSEACHEEYILSEKVVYCGRKAKYWSDMGFKNIRKTWTLKEVWYYTTSCKTILKRTITWVGTLEEYCENYKLFISASRYTRNLEYFSGTAMKNTPEGTSPWDGLAVDILN